MLISKLDSDVILSFLHWQVFHLASTVSVVLAVDLGLSRPINGQGQASLSSSLHIDSKYLLVIGEATLQTRAIGLHPAGITARCGVNDHGALRDGDVFIGNINRVRS